jgi:hypothetical protein
MILTQSVLTPKVHATSCKALLAKLGVEDILSKDPQLRAALDAVLARYSQTGVVEPKLIDLSEPNNKRDPHAVNFYNFRDLLKVREVIKSDKTEDLSLDGKVIKVSVTPTRDVYFRPIALSQNFYPERAPRKTIAASILNQMLKLNTVARSFWGQVNDQYGSISEAVLGQKYSIAKKQVDPKSFSNAMAFEFLVANADGVERNFYVDAKGQVQVFDHDLAFMIGLVKSKVDRSEDEIIASTDALLGIRLPERYTRELHGALLKLKRSQLDRQLEYLLSYDERDAIMFRRDIILADIELRGSQRGIASLFD